MWGDDKAQGWGVKIFSCGDRHEVGGNRAIVDRCGTFY
jgi:hypothetical protein